MLPPPAKPAAVRVNTTNNAACNLPTIDDVDSARTLTPTTTCETPREELGSHPFSAFYCHPTTRYSFEVQKSESKPIINVMSVDLEACRGVKSLELDQQRKDCTVWPGKQTKRSSLKRCRQKRGPVARFKSLSPNVRLLIKVLLVLVVLALAIGLGLGISKAVGGGVYKSSTQTNARIGSR